MDPFLWTRRDWEKEGTLLMEEEGNQQGLWTARCPKHTVLASGVCPTVDGSLDNCLVAVTAEPGWVSVPARCLGHVQLCQDSASSEPREEHSRWLNVSTETTFSKNRLRESHFPRLLNCGNHSKYSPFLPMISGLNTAEIQIRLTYTFHHQDSGGRLWTTSINCYFKEENTKADKLRSSVKL